MASRSRINRRPASRAESVQADVPAIDGLSLFRRFAGQKHEPTWMSDDDRSQWRAADNLAICAVANGRRFGISFGLLGSEFIGDIVETRKIASRSIEARNKPKLHGIIADNEHEEGARRRHRRNR
jgi:hypothetical protein